jgi:hypothetical protein
MQAKRLGDYLDRGDGTSRLVPQAALLLAIRQHLSEVLPDNLRRSCSIANYKQGVVVVIAGNSAVAAKLRHYEPKIVETLGKRGLKATGIRVGVQGAPSFAAQVSEKKALFLSPRAASALAQLGRRLPDGRLRQAVDALAKRTTGRTVGGTTGG